MCSSASEFKPTFFQRCATLFTDLHVALKFVFARRKFALGFCAGWCLAFALDTLFVRYVLHNKSLLGDSFQQFLGVIFG